MSEVTGIVVAGGKGTRLGGRDKAFLEIDGEPIIARTLRTLRPLFEQIVVVTFHPERFGGFDVDVTGDVYPGCGPLAGVHAGLLASRAPHAFVVACDMPRIDPDVIRFLIDRIDAGPGGADAIVPRWEGDVEPLHAVYARRCASAMADDLERGCRAIRDFLGGARVDYVPEHVLASLPGSRGSFTNVNTPAELRRLLDRRRGARAPGAGTPTVPAAGPADGRRATR
jgi:molybdopterin-guanine dinucleotide biosynthesis protein A